MYVSRPELFSPSVKTTMTRPRTGAVPPDARTDHTVGFVDLGTNSVRLLLVRINANHSFTVLSEQKETVRLGEGEFRRNLLQPEAMRRAGLVVARFAEIAEGAKSGCPISSAIAGNVAISLEITT